MITPRLPVAVLASGRGSNLQALIDAQHTGRLPIELVLVASNRAQAFALQRAEAAGIATLALEPALYSNRQHYDEALFQRIAGYAPALIVLAGFMRVLDANVVRQWEGKMINIHPSLLPKYRGLKTHQQVLDANDIAHGASIHYVTAELDGGPVIAQAEIAVQNNDTSESLAARLLPLEHALLCTTVELIAHQRVHLQAGRVLYDNAPISTPLILTPNGNCRVHLMHETMRYSISK